MIRILRYFTLAAILCSTVTWSFAQFPYIESFRAATAPGITFGGAPSAFLTAAGSSADGGTPIDPAGNGYLRLTNNITNQKGYVYSASDFPSKNGLRVEFEYYIYGGNGADGISFFLFDATAAPFTIGGFGGSLGYAQITTTAPISPGVSKGYLAIGLDEFGNFSNPNEGRQGGIGFRPGSITLRGKGDGTALTPENYKYLTSALTSEYGINLVGNASNRVPDSLNTGYRRVLMTLAPNPTVGYDITVTLTRGGPTLTRATIINKYHYSEAPPKYLRYGFASSTGAKTNYHEVRNVSIAVYDQASLIAPTANSDEITICQGNTVVLDVASNDLSTNEDAIINKTSIDLDLAAAGIQKTLTIAGKGIATANNDGTITFVPNSSFSGPLAINYTIKDTYGKTSSTGVATISYTQPLTTVTAGTDKLLTYIGVPMNIALEGSIPGAGNTGSWTQITGPSAATITNSTLNNSTVTNLLGGVYVFRWTVTSLGGCQAYDDIEIYINRRPLAVDDNISTNVNTEISIPIISNDTDADGNNTIDLSTILPKTNPQFGTIIVDNVAGTVIYRPNTGFIGSDSFTYSIKDIRGAESNTAIVTIQVSLKPIGVNDFASTIANTAVTIPVIDNDPGKNGTTVIKNTDPTNGIITINPGGTIVYTPSATFSGRDSFTYKLITGTGVESDAITVTVSVKPVGTADQATILAGTSATINLKDNDASSLGTNVLNTTNPINGSITINSSGISSYTPNTGFSGKDSFIYYLRTQDGLESDLINVTINVRPVGANDNVVTPMNTAISISVKNNDISKLATSVVTTSTPLNGSVSTDVNGIVTYTPNNDFSGQNNFTYILRTADGLESDPINVNISIKPIGVNDNANTLTNVPVTINAKDNDISKNNTSVVLFNSPLNGSAVLNAFGNIVYTPITGYAGKDNFNYILRTADGFDSDPIQVTVNIKPLGTADEVIGITTLPVAIPVKDNDASKTLTTVLINTDPLKGTVSVNATTGVVTFTPNPNFTGADSFTYILRTADGLDSDPITVTLNSKPSGSPDIANTNAGSLVTIPVKDNDASKTGTSVVLQANPTKGTVVLNVDGNPVYTPIAGTSGKDIFTYKLRDLNGAESDLIQVTVNVRPVGTADSKSTPVNTPAIFDIKSNDASKDGTTVILNTDPAHGIVTFNGLNATFIPANGYIGSDSFTYLLRTADGLESAPIAVNLTITPAIPAPNITIEAPIEKTTLIDIPIPLGGSYEITVPPAHGTITTDPVTGKPVYTPNPGYTGPDEFTYIIKDGNGNTSNPGKVNLTIYKPAKIGIAKALTSNVYNQDGSSRLNFLFTLVNYGDAVIDRVSLTDNLAAAFPGRTITINRINGSGTLKINNDYNGTSVTNMLLATSTLAANFKEVVELEITLSAAAQGGTFNNSATAQGFSAYDGSTTTDISTTGLTPDPVTPGDVTPQTPTQVVILLAPNLNVPASSGQPVTIPVTVPQGGSVIITRQPTNGTITFDPVTGQPIYTPKPGYSGPDDFTYVIRDPNGNISPQGTVTITVTLPAKIGLAKKLASQVKNIDGSYNLRFMFTMVNTGDFAIDRLSLTEDLALAFPETTFQVVNVTTTSTTLRINTAFNGLNNRNLLLPASTINAQFKEEVILELKVVLDKREGLFNNFATVEGFSTNDGSQVNDQSTDGSNPDPFVAGDFRPSILTPITLEKGTFKIPAGFSPNNDGINDFFIIENVIGKKIQLEVFNRWGNRIFRATDYQNNWSGKSTEGIHLGEDVPVGTYYYIITIDGKDKRVGYITINR